MCMNSGYVLYAAQQWLQINAEMLNTCYLENSSTPEQNQKIGVWAKTVG